jgi:potassium-transporting ATPase potassium-binding subunit
VVLIRSLRLALRAPQTLNEDRETLIAMWFLPILIIGTAIVVAIPLGLIMARVMDGRSRYLGWIERRIDTGPQNWKQYAVAMLLWNLATFIVGFLILALQTWLPLNQDKVGPLAPTTIFNTVCSFLSNTNLQHYAGEQQLSYFSQLVFVCWKQFHSPAIGLAVIVAITRALRGDAHMGNFYVDLWRGLVYIMLPLCLLVGVLLIACGVPMTLDGAAEWSLDGVIQKIARGPVAAIVAIKQLGTNGGGFFGANSCHPFENPNDWSNYLTCVCIVVIPMAVVVMFGRMLNNLRHAAVIFGVMLVQLLALAAWAIYWDSMQPNPALTEHQGNEYEVEDPASTTTPRAKLKVQFPSVDGLPVDQELGNLEGHELRFGTSAGPTWAAITTCTSNGSVNCMHDSLHPLAGLTPFTGMWLNCNFGGIGVGLVNMLVYLIVAVFLAGLMVGRTPEYLGKKVEAREMKLAMLALLIHPLLVLGGAGLFCYTAWNKAATNPAAHGFSQILYEFSSASANNGSGFEGLNDSYGVIDSEGKIDNPNKLAVPWDIATGLVMLIGRFIPIIAPLAFAGSLAAKKPTPFTSGTLRTDTFTFGCVLLGTVILVGALLFLPAAVLGPVAEHLGPIPFPGN